MISFKEYHKEKMKDPEFRKAYEDLEPEYRLISIIIEKRMKEGLTQKELARRMGTKQSAISRFESGASNPTIGFMRRVAEALGVRLKVSIIK